MYQNHPHGMHVPKTAANEHGAYEDSMIDTHVKLQINHLNLEGNSLL